MSPLIVTCLRKVYPRWSSVITKPSGFFFYRSVENSFFFFSGLVVIIHCRDAAAVFQLMDDDVKQILMFYQVQVIIHMCEGLIPFVS